MVHSTNVLMYGLSTNAKKKRLIVFTIVKNTSTNKEIPYVDCKKGKFFLANNLLIAKFPRPSAHILNTVES